MRFSIDTAKEIRNGLEKSGLSRLDLYYPAIFVPVMVDTEYEDEPWEYAETWVAFYFARPIITTRGRLECIEYFDSLNLFADDYLTCYRKINLDGIDYYNHDIRELGIAESDSLWNDMIKTKNYYTIYSALTKSVFLYNEIFGETEEEERVKELLDYRKVH